VLAREREGVQGLMPVTLHNIIASCPRRADTSCKLVRSRSDARSQKRFDLWRLQAVRKLSFVRRAFA
jgi:hypothetical protein